MAIWAVANIVRNMSALESEPSAAIARSAVGHTEHNAAAANKYGNDSAESTARTHENRSAEPPPLDCQEPNGDTPAMNSLAPQLSDGFRRIDSDSATDEQTTKPIPQPAAQTRNRSEAEFQFVEIDHRHSAVGHTPPSETLDIELGSVQMPRDDAERLEQGVVVALQEAVDDEILLRNGERAVAKGKISVVEGKIAIRISEIMDR